MNERNHWQQFWMTGSVEDYLSYKNGQKLQAGDGMQTNGFVPCENTLQKENASIKAGNGKEGADAGTFHGYGDDIKSGTFRGI